MRLFVALDIDAPTRAWAAERQEALQRQWSGPRLRWAPPGQWHLTLQFLGECPEQQIPAIQAAMRQAVSGMSPFPIRLGDPGVFAGPRMGVLWLGIAAGREALTQLVGRLRESSEAAGFEKNKQPFRGHLTLARSATKIPTQALRRLPPAPPSPELRVDRLTLYKSVLGSKGAHYAELFFVDFNLR